MENLTKNLKKVFLTIDFEDFNYDLRRSLGINNILINKKNLFTTYSKINSFCKNSLFNTKITFFCTGIIADKCPEIIKLISNDGHEIACHSFYHDHVNKTPLKQFEYQIKKAIEKLESASNQRIKGFRAPYFSMNENNFDHYNIIQKYFEYDSSLHSSNLNEITKFRRKLRLETLKIIPVPSIKVFFNKYHYKLGGTAFKFLSQNNINKIIETAIINKIPPIIYLHPYEFFDDFLFYVTKKQMKDINIWKQQYWLLKQYQWHKFGNSSVIPKLKFIFKNYDIGGSIAENYLKNDQ